MLLIENIKKIKIYNKNNNMYDIMNNDNIIERIKWYD